MCPYLITTFAIEGPLTDFQGRQANEKGTWDLLLALRATLPDSRISDRMLKNRFEKRWPVLESRIAAAQQESGLDSNGPEYNEA